MKKLPVNIEYHSAFSAIVQRLKIAFRVLTYKKVTVTVIFEDKQPVIFKQNFFEMSNGELKRIAELTLRNLSEQQQIDSDVNELLHQTIYK